MIRRQETANNGERVVAMIDNEVTLKRFFHEKDRIRLEPANSAMRFRIDGYGTVSSALIALPARGEPDRRPVFRFAEWLPQTSPWRDVMDPERGSQA